MASELIMPAAILPQAFVVEVSGWQECGAIEEEPACLEMESAAPGSS